MGKPVISFGRHNLYNILPHVRVINDEKHLKNELAWALSEEFKKDIALSDGKRFLAAVVNGSFDLGKFDTSHGKNYDELEVQRAYKSLVNGLSN